MKNIVLIAMALVSVSCFAQKKLPILNSTSKILSVKERNVVYDDAWGVSAQVKWDEYVMQKFEGEAEISFYSDIDTLSFAVEPNRQYDFVVLLNGEKAYTRISTDTSKEASYPEMEFLQYHRMSVGNKASSDTIPFRIGKDNRIHITGKINGSDSLDFLFDTGANAFVITSSLIGERVKLKIDGETENAGSDGISIKKTSSGNQLEIGDLVWEDASLISIDYKKPSFDGVLGWIAFGGKVVKIDYEQEILIIYSEMPVLPPGYSRVKTSMIGGVPFIWGQMTVNGKKSEGWFEYDTGGVRSFYLSQKYAHENGLNDSKMKLIETTTSSGSKGVKWKRNVFRLPKLKFGEFETYQIPIAIAEKDPEGVEHNDILGNNLLKRFNAIIDFKNFEIYLRPNELLHSTY